MAHCYVTQVALSHKKKLQLEGSTIQLPHPLTLTDWDSTPINFPDVQRTDIENYFNKCKSYNCLQYINVINKSSSHNCARVSNMISRIPRVKKSFAFSQNRTNHTCMSLQWL